MLTSSQVQAVLPGSSSLPGEWGGVGGGGEDVLYGAEAAKDCGFDTGTSCAGLTARGMRVVEQQTAEELVANAPEQTVFIKVYAFDSVENAAVASKAMVAREREDNDDAQPLKIAAGAEETEAFSMKLSDRYSTSVTMRTGAVVISLKGSDLKNADDMQALAKLQVDRIAKTAAGKNPDA